MTSRLRFPVPPPVIHSRVTGEEYSDETYRDQCVQLADGLDRLLSAHALRMEQFHSVLDFGCGCGRVLVNYAHLPGIAFYGTDIDEVSIGWCREHIPGMEFSVNGAMPPLPWPNGQFDLVMAISVFTHIPWKMQIDWLIELRRVLAPGGYLIATTHGDFYADTYLGKEALSAYKTNGYCYLRVPTDPPIFPDWYQATFVNADYVHRVFGRLFEHVLHVPRGFCDRQDAVIMRRD